MRYLQVLVRVVLFGWLVILASCITDLEYLGNPTPIEIPTSTTGEGGSGGDLFSTGGGAGSEPFCAGACVASQPAWFQGLSMFWIGPPEEAPPCPADVAPFAGSVGYADLKVEPHTCPACSCSPAACALTGAMHVSAAKCPADGASSVDWDPPPGWEGVCSAEDALPGGQQCSGVPCHQSLTVSAVVVEPCAPSAQGEEAIPPLSWGTIARECSIGPLTGDGCQTGQACVPVAPEGFAMCVYRFGDDDAFACPAGYDDRRLVVYADAADDRRCEPCSCSAPEGANCAAFVEAFAGESCGTPVGSVLVTEEEAACVDLPSGTVLGSKSAVLAVDEPGSCTPGGGAAGTVEPAGPVTLCCQPVVSGQAK